MALQLEYRGGSYFISEEELNDASITEMSAYLDEDLSQIAEIDGGCLVFKKEQMDETTMASSAGAYVPALTAGIVRRKIDVGRSYDMKQSDENEVVKGFELKKPIGKIFSLGLKEGEEEVIQSKGYLSEYTSAIWDAFSKLAKYRLGDWRKLMRGEEVMVDLVPTHEHRGFPNKFKFIPTKPNAAEYFIFERIDGDEYKVKATLAVNEMSLSDIIKNKVKSILSEEKVNETVDCTHIPDDNTSEDAAWADHNGDGWWWNDTPAQEGGEIIDLFPKFTKKRLNSLMGKENIQEQQVEETATASSGAAGAYVTPAMWAKNRRNWRMAAKPTWNKGAFVKFKDKCVKYNNKKWCSQGAIDKPIELVSTLMETAYKLSEETGKDMDYITQLITKKYSVPNEHVTDSVIELAKASGYDMFSGVGQTEFTKDVDGATEYEITVDGVTGDIHAMIHDITNDTFSGKTFDSFEDAIDYLENI